MPKSTKRYLKELKAPVWYVICSSESSIFYLYFITDFQRNGTISMMTRGFKFKANMNSGI